MRSIAEVVEDIKNGTWGSDIEYQSECEKLHKLCDEILEIEKAKMERIVAELIQFGLNSMDKQIYDSDTYYDGVSVAIRKACNIVKRGEVEELKEIEKNRADSCDEDGCGDGEQIFDDGRSQGRFEQTHKIIKIVNELAEEFATDINVVSKNGWIPCSERLPEDNTNVIACFGTGTVTELRYIGSGIFKGIYEYTTKVIIAWQPLPAPYKEGE